MQFLKTKIKQVFIPGGCTGDLQPLDVAVNGSFKTKMKKSFMDWFALKVADQLEGKDLQKAPVDLRTATVKPIHANSLISTIQLLAAQEDTLLRGWKETGIFDAVCGVSADYLHTVHV